MHAASEWLRGAYCYAPDHRNIQQSATIFREMIRKSRHYAAAGITVMMAMAATVAAIAEISSSEKVYSNQKPPKAHSAFGGF